MILWKNFGQKTLSAGYIFILFLLFLLMAMHGPGLMEMPQDPSKQSILHDTLSPIFLQDFGENLAAPLAFLDIYGTLVLGFLGAYSLAKTFGKLFNTGNGIVFFMVLIFLSPYMRPVLGEKPIAHLGYSYPLFLFSIRNLIWGLARCDSVHLMRFFLLSSLGVVLKRHFLFLSLGGCLAALCAFLLNPQGYKGKKRWVLLGVLLSLGIPDLCERTMNYRRSGAFITLPFVGFQFMMTPLYISSSEDMASLPPPVSAFLGALRQPLADAGILYDAPDTPSPVNAGDTQGPEGPQSPSQKIQRFFNAYDTLAYTSIKPLIQTAAAQNPTQADQFLILMSLTLIFNNFMKYVTVYLENIIVHMGGYFMAGLGLLIFVGAFRAQLLYRDTLSLVTLCVSSLCFANYSLVALLEPVKPVYSFYTETLLQGILVILITKAFQKPSLSGPPADDEEPPPDSQGWLKV